MTKTLPPYIAKMPRIFKYRTTTDSARDTHFKPAFKATGDRLAYTESDQPGKVWIWARTQEDAGKATAAMPELHFEPSA